MQKDGSRLKAGHKETLPIGCPIQINKIVPVLDYDVPKNVRLQIE